MRERRDLKCEPIPNANPSQPAHTRRDVRETRPENTSIYFALSLANSNVDIVYLNSKRDSER
jgi:hypothetical protein